MAGVSRLQYATDIRLIRVMCSGRVDLEFILRAFAKGLDGVFIGGCRLNECNYSTHGNYHALNLVLLAKKILAHLGLNPARLRIDFMSSGDGLLFSSIINDFSANINALGPLGGELSNTAGLSDFLLELNRVRKLVPYIKMTKKSKLEQHLKNDADYEDFFTTEEIDALINNVVSYDIDPEKCRACMKCLKRCPTAAILGGKNQIHVIDQDKCIKCGTCAAVCPERFSAVRKSIT